MQDGEMTPSEETEELPPETPTPPVEAHTKQAGNQPVDEHADDQPIDDQKPVKKSGKNLLVAVVVIVLLALGGLAAYVLVLKQKPQEESGAMYLGPSNEQKTPTAPLRFTISPTTKWRDYQGKIFPYTFSYPETLSLVVFTNDPTDSVAISWGNIPPQLNVLLHVDDVANNATLAQYVGKPRDYVDNWWKQYPGLQGVLSMSEFTNAKGLHGYRAKYVNNAGEAPNDNVFFAVPGRGDLMVMFANGVLDPSVFDRILDSFDWKGTAPTAAPVTTSAPAATTSSPAPLP